MSNKPGAMHPKVSAIMKKNPERVNQIKEELQSMRRKHATAFAFVRVYRLLKEVLNAEGVESVDEVKQAAKPPVAERKKPGPKPGKKRDKTAPFGKNADGTVIAPFGFKNGLPRMRAPYRKRGAGNATAAN